MINYRIETSTNNPEYNIWYSRIYANSDLLMSFSGNSKEHAEELAQTFLMGIMFCKGDL